MGMYQDRDIFDVLGELQYLFNHHAGSSHDNIVNILERYHYFIRFSEHGKRCAYATKAKELFVKYDWEKAKKLILEAADMIRTIDNVTNPPLPPPEDDEDGD